MQESSYGALVRAAVDKLSANQLADGAGLLMQAGVAAFRKSGIERIGDDKFYEHVYDALKNVVSGDFKAAGLLLRRASYVIYLRSAEWKAIRQQALDLAGHKCKTCGTSERLSVHHVRYSCLFYENLRRGDCEVLCTPCHDKLHDRNRHLKG